MKNVGNLSNTVSNLSKSFFFKSFIFEHGRGQLIKYRGQLIKIFFSIKYHILLYCVGNLSKSYIHEKGLFQ